MPDTSVVRCRERQNDVSEIVSDAIRRAYRNVPYRASALALDAETSQSTAEKWACGQREPDTRALLALMRNNRAFRAEILAATDPDVALFRATMARGISQ